MIIQVNSVENCEATKAKKIHIVQWAKMQNNKKQLKQPYFVGDKFLIIHKIYKPRANL